MFWLSTRFENILVSNERRSSILSTFVSIQSTKKHMDNIFEFPAEPTQKMLDGQNEGQPRVSAKPGCQDLKKGY